MSSVGLDAGLQVRPRALVAGCLHTGAVSSPAGGVLPGGGTI